MSSSTRDNWQRLVEAVMKRELYLELAHKPYSRNTSINTVASDYTDQILDNSLESATPSPSPSPSPHQVPPTKRPPLIPQEKKNASGPITWKLFSTLQRRRKPKDNYLDSIPEDLQLHLTRLRRFSLHELQLATDNFSNRNILRRGGFGKAYKGRLVDGLLVVVKRRKLKKITIQLEVATIAAHCNILCVYGFCFTKKECVLIFPYMTNGSVASLLRERPAHQPCLNWLTRKEIALGTARGLAYLHDECESGRIIHCDIKAANILLNEDFEVVIADFGFAMIMDQYSTGVLRDVVKGTIGHIPPECLSSGEFSEKNDVFGYGVFLLELITGQRAFDLARVTNDEDVMLLDWVKKYFKEKQWKMVADPDSGGDDMEEVVEQLSVISLLCTQHSPEGRPKMSEIVRMLEVGDVYGERWEAWCNPVETVDESVGLNMHDDTWTTESVGLNMYDDTLTLPPFQLSEPR